MFEPPTLSRHATRALPMMIALCALLIMLSACGRKRTRIPSITPPVAGTVETGIASWYGYPYHGRRAANGEVYDMERLTAAHRTLPFGTWVRVRNLTNGKTVDVRITDRGPFVDGRIIDLSLAAARQIEMVGPGIVNVRVEVIDQPLTVGMYAVQVGAFRSYESASTLRASMERRYGAAFLVRRDGDPPMWRVLVGQDLSDRDAAALAERIRVEVGPAFVVLRDWEATDGGG